MCFPFLCTVSMWVLSDRLLAELLAGIDDRQRGWRYREMPVPGWWPYSETQSLKGSTPVCATDERPARLTKMWPGFAITWPTLIDRLPSLLLRGKCAGNALPVMVSLRFDARA